jgi:hypothetical protein|tara:strand:+ start:198 stop:491 length:294 start_codon:yes stop_codon:yes gene_type:complete
VRKERVENLKMNIYDQFHLPPENNERENALKTTVAEWFAHEECASEEDIIESLRSRDDVCSNRPAPVSTKEEIFNSKYFYDIAFKFENEINNTLELN